MSPQSARQLVQLTRLSWPFISGAGWSPDGHRLAITSAGGVALWQGGFGGQPDLRLASDVPIKGVAFAPDSTRLATAAAYGFIDLWDAQSGQRKGQLQRAAISQAAYHAVAWSAGGQHLAFAGVDQRVYIWDMIADQLERTLNGHTGEVTALAWLPGGWLVSGGRDATVRLWDERGHALAVIPITDWVRQIAVTSAGDRLAVTCKSGAVYVGSVGVDGQPILHAIALDQSTAQGEIAPVVHTGGADAVDFSPDGRRLVTGGRDGAVRVWQLNEPGNAASLTAEQYAHTRPVLAAAWHPAGELLITGGGDNVLNLWRL